MAEFNKEEINQQNKTYLSKFKYYCNNTHLHGWKYIGGGTRSRLERFLWALSFTFYWVGMIFTFKSIFNNFNENPVSFLTETTFLDWNTTFPSITVCQISGMDMSLSEEVVNKNESAASQEFFLSDVLFFTGSCYSCQSHCDSCSKFNITDLVKKLRKPCSKLLSTCKWNNIEFNCCEQFLPLETEYGVCFSLNSLHTGYRKPDERFLMNRKTGTGELSLNTLEDVRVYFHATEDVPYINFDSNYRKDILVGDSYRILFNVIEIENENKIKHLPLQKRGCRFSWERPKNLKVHSFYSYSTCIVQCHADNHLKLCNCTHHLMPFYNRGNYCNINGLMCLTDNFESLNRIHADGYDKPGLICDCLPSCTEPEYTIVSDEKIRNLTTSGLIIKMQSLPTSRFKRVVVKSFLDLVVSIGGAAGLFLGASILTIIELVYLLFLNTQ